MTGLRVGCRRRRKKHTVGQKLGPVARQALLEFERGGDAYTPNLHARLEDVRRIARAEAADGSNRLIEERAFRERIAEAEIAIEGLETIELQVLSDVSRGHNRGAVSSLMRVRGSETLAAFDRLGMEALAGYAAPFEPEARLLEYNQPTVTPDYGITALPLYPNNPTSTIYARSNEIQRNIIAKAVLGV
jgi:alkylation response protein AidB-like acyl-CoA dehydrogenase